MLQNMFYDNCPKASYRTVAEEQKEMQVHRKISQAKQILILYMSYRWCRKYVFKWEDFPIIIYIYIYR